MGDKKIKKAKAGDPVGQVPERNPAADEIRALRWHLRQANRTMGNQGQTIHRLRAELAEVRELNSKLDRGELRRLERVTEEQLDEINALEEKLAAADALDGGTAE